MDEGPPTPSDLSAALAAGPPHPTLAEAQSLVEPGAKSYVPRPYNPMTIDVRVTQGNRVVSLLDLRARRERDG